MRPADKIALALSLLGVLVSYLVADRVFERMAHIEDEMAFVWQAQVIAEGQLTVPSPEQSKHFLVPFVIDYNGQRFGKYPLGWPVLLSFGERLGLRAWINPLLGGAAVWLTYLLGKRVFSEMVGLLAAALTATSPFFLMNSGSLLSHPFGLVLSAAFALAWLDNFGEAAPRRWTPTLAAAFALGLLFLTRPYTAVAVAAPFGLHALYLLRRGDQQTRVHLIWFGIVALSISSLHFLWQAAVTGDPLLNPYTLWWKYDKVGFGEGYGRYDHDLNYVLINTNASLRAGIRDLFGWGNISWLFLPFGLWAARRNRQAWLVGSIFFSLLLFYTAYWIGATLFGPRYYYEGLYSLTILTAAGICWLAGWPLKHGDVWPRFSGWAKARPLGVTALLALLIAGNLLFYVPVRVGGMHGLYGIQRSNFEPFLTPEAQSLAPAYVIVHAKVWTDYGGLLELQDAFLQSPLIFIYSRGPTQDAAFAAAYAGSGRAIYHYYPDEPGAFYEEPRRGP